jgi:hypothetical protein
MIVNRDRFRCDVDYKFRLARACHEAQGVKTETSPHERRTIFAAGFNSNVAPMVTAGRGVAVEEERRRRIGV